MGDVIDAVFVNEDENAVVLVLVQPESWDADGDRIFDVQRRLNEYLAFALDGDLARFPEAEGRQVVISVECAEPPVNENEVRFFESARGQLAAVDVELRV